MEALFLAGFMSAFGWWSAGKVTAAIDEHFEDPPAIIKETQCTNIEQK